MCTYEYVKDARVATCCRVYMSAMKHQNNFVIIFDYISMVAFNILFIYVKFIVLNNPDLIQIALPGSLRIIKDIGVDCIGRWFGLGNHKTVYLYQISRE